jgi:UDPglucose--hexose-1-phosphate uridylyltransferase
MQRTLRRVHGALNDPDYNYVVRSAPIHEESSPHLDWYIAVVPRVSPAAGFELGSGMFINSALPEESAAFLRELAIDG